MRINRKITGGGYNNLNNISSSEKYNWSLVNFCEFDKYAIKSYCAIHNVKKTLNLGDINTVDENNIDDFTMICGGSPCQDFSVAGKQKGSIWTCNDCGHEFNPLTVHWSNRTKCPKCNSENIEKTRSSLLVEYLRIIRAKRPKFGLYENVKNIVSKKFKDTTFKLFTDELEEYGYNVYWKVLNAKNYGIPQNRERVYVVFIKKEIDNGKFKFPDPFDNGLRLKDMLEDEVDEKYYISDQKLSKVKDTISKSSVFNSGISTVLMKNKGEQITKKTDVANTLLARDYKGFGNQEMNAVVHIPQATKKGYIECEVGGVADLSYPDSKTRRGRVQDNGNICPTITASEGGICRIEPKERFFKQALETFNSSDSSYGDTIDAYNKKINQSGVSPTLTTRPEGFKTAILPVTQDIRIRKLTPREAFRLMGFSDYDFNVARHAGVSNSQLYKQAGNSIVVDVLYYIYVELYKAMPYLFRDLKLSSFFSGIGAFEAALDRLYESVHTGNFINPQAN